MLQTCYSRKIFLGPTLYVVYFCVQFFQPILGEDRLSKFVEYRGEDIIMPHAQDISQQAQRPTLSERERDQSLPPGATMENIGDFYKSSQNKSMYQLPPSPTRTAPGFLHGVLEMTKLVQF